MKDRTNSVTKDFFCRNTDLEPLRKEVLAACDILLNAFLSGNKLLICGNGGSCADSDHIVGELMKSFVLERRLAPEDIERFRMAYGETGELLAGKLQGSLPAISLNAHAALGSAFSNDVDPALIYAQQVLGYAKPGDVLLGISTSGNAKNVYHAAMTAKIMNAKFIALTGKDGGRLTALADCSIVVPQQETYRIQESHLRLYHFICLFIESEMFES